MNNGIKPLQRYDIELGDDDKWNSRLVIEESDNGNWVRDEDVKELEEQNKEMLEALKMAESEIKCQQLEADFNYNQCHGLPHPTLEEMERQERWCDEVYMLRELIKRIEGEQE